MPNRTRRPNGLWKQVVALHRKHPNWTSGQIAAELGLPGKGGSGYVRKTLNIHKQGLRQWPSGR